MSPTSTRSVRLARAARCARPAARLPAATTPRADDRLRGRPRRGRRSRATSAASPRSPGTARSRPTRLETETLVTEGDGDGDRGGRPGPHPPLDRQRRSPRTTAYSAPTTRTHRRAAHRRRRPEPAVPQGASTGADGRLPRRRSPRPPRTPSATAGNPSSGIGNKDTVLIVVDLAQRMLLDGPQGTRPRPRRAGRPSRREATATPTGPRLHRHARSPTDKLGRPRWSRATARRSRRARRSYVELPRPGLRRQGALRRELLSGEPASFPIGTGAVVKGWDQALVGVDGRQPGAARDPAGARLRRGRATRTPASRAPTRSTSSSTSSPRPEPQAGESRRAWRAA